VTTSEDEFVRLCLSGGRFEAEGMPVEVLAELVAYRELVIGVAKELFRQQHPQRQRLPSGFTDRLQLRLRVIERGSVVPVLERMRSVGVGVLPFGDDFVSDEFTMARNLIEDAVAAVVAGTDIPADFPRSALVLFNGLGQTLRVGETIELQSSRLSAGVKYTREVGRQLVLLERSTFQDEVRDIGRVWEVDSHRMTCALQLRLGPSSPITAPLDELTFEPIKEALAPNGQGPPLHIIGLGVFDSTRGLLRLDAIHDVSRVEDPADLEAVDSRLDELEGLRGGWLDGYGAAPTPPALRSARRIVAELLGLEVPKPRLYPTPDGGVQAEWTAGESEINVTFNSDGTPLLVAVDIDSGEANEVTNVEPGEIARFVRRFA
jgi:hypothetical protein